MSDDEFQDGLPGFVAFIMENAHVFQMAAMLALQPAQFEPNDGFDRFLAATLQPVEIGE